MKLRYKIVSVLIAFYTLYLIYYVGGEYNAHHLWPKSSLNQKNIILWTVHYQYPSQLLQTINNTFYPNINIQTAANITTILEHCDIDCSVLYSVSNNNDDNYSTISLNPFSMNDYNLIMKKSITIYIEYPSCIVTNEDLCYPLSDIKTAKCERAVVVSPKLRPLKQFDIIDLHQAMWIDITSIAPTISCMNNLLMIAKVAGYDYAVYKFGETITYPLLYESGSNNNMIISLTSFSNYSIARYVPFEHTKNTLTYIINKLMNTKLTASQIAWIPHVIQPTFKTTGISMDIKQSFQRGIDWIFNSKLLVSEYITVNAGSGHLPTPSPNTQIGDGSNGVFEGFISSINTTGGQDQSIIIRTDCQAEIAASLAWSGYLVNNPYHNNVSFNLLNFIFNTSIAQKGERNNSNSSAYGLLAWGVNSPEWADISYCDDNARSILASMMAIALLHKNNLNADKFVPHVVRAILGNFRLTSRKGFCQRRVSMDKLSNNFTKNYNDSCIIDELYNYNNTWQYYWNSSYEFDDPHYVSWIWCSYLFTYYITGYEPMYERTLVGMENIMNAFYTGKLHWANGLTQEYSRLLLPLSFLIRIEDKANMTHLKWLTDIGNELKIHEINGTIKEYYGNLSYGVAKPPQNNSQYGTTEAPLQQENSDTVSDSLYTLCFALWGMHEAYLLTDNHELFGEPLNNLINYLMNIQTFVNSEHIEYSYLNGSWFRGFDFTRNEYFASSSDSGWGPYSIESGWTMGEILSSFGMIMTNNSFFDIVNGDTLQGFTEYVQYYIPIFGLPAS